MFHTSSGQRRRLNFDGSVQVFCYSCGEFIGNTNVMIASALCEMCRRVLGGEEITEEMIRTYKLAKGPRGEVGMLIVPEQPKGTKFTLRSLGGDIVQALGLKKEKPIKAEKSRQVAKSKERGRLFENIDLGSMEELNSELNRQKEGK